VSRTSRGHVSPHDAVVPPGIRPELNRRMLMNCCHLFKLEHRHGLCTERSTVWKYRPRQVLRVAEHAGSVSPRLLIKYLRFCQQVRKINYAEVPCVHM
jgi:hypothetical protein